MKYIEELSNGDCFTLSSSYYIVTSDFKKDGRKLCLNLKTGLLHWIKPDESVDEIDIFTIDKDNNILAIKERKKDNRNELPKNS